MKVCAKEPPNDCAYTTEQESSATAGECSVPIAGAGSCPCASSYCGSDRSVCFVATLETHFADTLSIENDLGGERPE